MNFELFIDFAKEQEIHGVRDWNKTFSSHRRPVLRLKDSKTKKVAGQLVLAVDDSEAWIYFFAVDPTIRGAGLGTRLITAAEKYCKSVGVETIKLNPQKEFEDRLVPWYEKLSYIKTTRNEKNNEWEMYKEI